MAKALNHPVAELRDYQIEALIEILLARGRYWEFDEMGLGKTPVAILALRLLGCNRGLIVGPKSLSGHWEAELQRWWPDAWMKDGTDRYAYRRQKHLSSYRQEAIKRGARPCFFYINYANVAGTLEEGGRYWQALIIDEAHRASNYKAAITKTLDRVESTYCLPLTGSPTSRGPKDLWAYARYTDKASTRGFWPWATKNLHTMKGNYGVEILGPQKPDEFRKWVREHGIRRRKKDVLKELPPKQRIPLYTRLYPEVQKIYDQLEEELVAEHGDQVLAVPSKLALNVRLRQLCVHPQLLGFDLPSAGLDAIVEKCQDIVEAGDSAVIFTPFRQAFPLIEAALKGLKAKLFWIAGGTDAHRISTDFRDMGRRGSCVLVSTTGVAEGWSAISAHRAFFLGFEWYEIPNSQCEDRLCRFGQTMPVDIYYAINRGTVDEHIVTVNNGKIFYREQSVERAFPTAE